MIDLSAEQTAGLPQQLAQQLFAEGAILIVAGVPSGTEFGIDLDVNKVDEMFRGVKMIPPGPHFVYTAADGQYGDTAARVGFVHHFKRQEIVIREWDDQLEELKERPRRTVDQDEARVRQNILDIDRLLAPFNFEHMDKWQQLSSEITENVIARTAPTCGVVRTSAEFQSCTDAERPRGRAPLPDTLNARHRTEDELLPDLKVIEGTELRFTAVPPLYAPDATPADISRSHLDAIDAIGRFLESFDDMVEPLREIQLAFVLYLCGYSVDALAHWRKILSLLCKSHTAVTKYEAFFRRYLEVLRAQLPELPEEMMMPTPNNTVFLDVRQLIVKCAAGGLQTESDAFIAHLTKQMSWYFDDVFDEDPDDLPVVVEMD